VQSTADGCLKNALSLASGKLIPQLLQILAYSNLPQDKLIKEIEISCRNLDFSGAEKYPSEKISTHLVLATTLRSFNLTYVM